MKTQQWNLLLTIFIINCYLLKCSFGLKIISHYVNDNNLTLTRTKRQLSDPNCKDGFQCKTTTECIDIDKPCDGRVDCKDGSDEFESYCKDQVCPGYLFRCDYGGCISSDERCNGVKNCKDNSDEVGCFNLEKINTNCRSDEFECDNGQCIDIDKKCNGIADCEDKSDETEGLCLNIYCPGYTYKCAYGACVNGDAKCNGIKECHDNSDENDETCLDAPSPVPPTEPTKTPSPPNVNDKNYCLTPNQPENGQWVYFNQNGLGKPGLSNEKISVNSFIVFSCNRGYKLSTNVKDKQYVLCEKQGWTFKEMPKCRKLCPAVYSTKTIREITCKDSGSGTIIPCDQATSGTILTYQCEPYHESPTRKVRYCSDGTWDLNQPICTPVCGEKRVSATPLIVGGKKVVRGNYPWVVAIYSNKDSSSNTFTLICGGSMLSVNIVLTAAHCVSKQKDGTPYNVKYYRVASGKYYNPYDDERDKDTAQYNEVDSIVINREYRGESQHFRGDIALLKLKNEFVLSKVVQPVCFYEVGEYSPQVYTEGVVTGWGYTISSGKVSDVLKELSLPFKDEYVCRSEFDEDWANKYLISDKICAGFLNKSTSVCKGDSGGGLVFKHPTNHRYYVHGIVSIGHAYTANNKVHCDTQTNTLFTRVEMYLDWLQSQVSNLSSDFREESFDIRMN